MAAGSLATMLMATLSVAARSVLIFNLHCLGSRAGIITVKSKMHASGRALGSTTESLAHCARRTGTEPMPKSVFD